MTNCREIADFLMAYVDGELPDDQRQVFDAHMTACPCCAKYLASYRTTVALGREALCGDDEHDTGDLPDELIRAVLAARRLDAEPDGPA